MIAECRSVEVVTLRYAERSGGTSVTKLVLKSTGRCGTQCALLRRCHPKCLKELLLYHVILCRAATPVQYHSSYLPTSYPWPCFQTKYPMLPAIFWLFSMCSSLVMIVISLCQYNMNCFDISDPVGIPLCI